MSRKPSAEAARIRESIDAAHNEQQKSFLLVEVAREVVARTALLIEETKRLISGDTNVLVSHNKPPGDRHKPK